jgi:hypothetical protein
MPKTRLLSLLLAHVLWLLPIAAHAADVAVFGPEISNLPAQDAEAVAGLIAQAYASASQQSVVPPSEARSATEAGTSYEAAAAKLGVKEYLRLSAVSAGRSLVISASRHRADGSVLFQTKQVSEGLEGVARDADAIAQALLGKTSLAAPPSPSPVSPAAEVEMPPAKFKEDTDNYYGFKTGVHFPLAKGANYWTGLSLQFVGRLQFPRFFIEFGAGFIVPTIIDDRYDESVCGFYPATGTTVCNDPDNGDRGYIGGFTTELGASYYLTKGNVVPYVGGGIIPRIVLAGLNNESHDIAGMLAYAQFGFTAPRHGHTHFFADIRLSQAILPQHLESGDPVWSTEPTLHAGLGW